MQVTNKGLGTVRNTSVTIFWPYEVRSYSPVGKHLLYLTEQPQVSAGTLLRIIQLQTKVMRSDNITQRFLSYMARPLRYCPLSCTLFNAELVIEPILKQLVLSFYLLAQAKTNTICSVLQRPSAQCNLLLPRYSLSS